jgi:hypothetical protein
MKRLQLQNRILVVLFLFLGTTSFLFSQELEGENFKRNKLSFLMAYGIIPEHTSEDDNTSNSLFIVPTIGVNYDFLFTPKIGLGLHTDVILQKFVVEELQDDLKVERVFPITTNLMASVRPIENWTFLAGGGAELETNKSYPMICLGVDYGIELNESWELGFSFMFEHRLQAYNSYLLGIGFTKSLGKNIQYE